MFHARRFTASCCFLAASTVTVLVGAIAFSSTAQADGLTASGLTAGGLAMEPYTVFVAESESYTRCGPAADYYRTDPLKHGQQLEVYAETEDGWLGVRPPEDSFCWVPAETIELDGSGEMGTVAEDRTVAWIGTHLGRARKYLWQVQLAEGEPVTVIGRQERDGPDGPQLWLRIVPPSGEFRWIHRNQTVRTSEALVDSLRETSREISKNTEIQFQPAGPTHIDRSLQGSPRPGQIHRVASATESSTMESEPVSSRRRLQADAQAIAQAIPPSIAQSISKSGRSVLNAAQAGPSSHRRLPDAAVGSGLDSGWKSNASQAPSHVNLPPSLSSSAGLAPSTNQQRKPRGLLASMAILGRPRLRDIGTGGVSTGHAPSSQTIASDDNWVSGAANRPVNASQTIAMRGAPMTLPAAPGSLYANQPSAMATASLDSWRNTSHDVMQVTGIAPLPTQNLRPAAPTTLMPTTTAPPFKTPQLISPERITQVQDQVRGSDMGSLRLVLSRLMAAQSSAAEVRVVADAARDLAGQAPDAVIAGQARLLSERADQYARLAERRDGTTQSPALPATPVTSPGPLSVAAPSSESDQAAFSGQLVQVYSARTHSPPFALTDGTGRTIAYVTPSPGINLRMHLNQQVTVTGTRGFVTGLNMPHVMAMRADR